MNAADARGLLRRVIAPCAMALLALVALVSAGACSLGAPHLPPLEDEERTPLAIAGPHDELVYTTADDDDPGVRGIQLTVRVDVDDELIERVDLELAGDTFSDVVAEDLAGRRAAFFDVTLAGADTPVAAHASWSAAFADAPAEARVQAILRAVQ